MASWPPWSWRTWCGRWAASTRSSWWRWPNPSTARALALGIANRIAPAAGVLDAALAMAGRLAGWEPAAMGLTKRAFHRAADLGLAEALGVGRDANVIMRGFRQGTPR